jgi:hypothetical protein
VAGSVVLRPFIVPYAGRAVASLALDWLVANLERFDPFPREAPPDEASQTALAELAMLVVQMRRRRALAADRRLARCLDLLDRVYREPLLHEFPFRHEPRALVGHVVLWTALADRGSERIVPRSRFEALVARGGVLADLTEPYRALELRYWLDLAGLRHDLPAADRLFARTILGGDLAVGPADEATAYVVTHTLFYATDYGLAAPAYLDAGRRARILALLRALLEQALDEEHWDLVGELLLCHRSLRPEGEALTDRAWEALARNQQEDGMIRHPDRRLTRLGELPPGEPRARYLFVRCHHMTLVAAMAGFLGIPDAQDGRA